MKLNSFLAAVLFCGATSSIHAVVIDFESLPDLTSVGGFFSGQGVSFQNAVSLTSGASLNEIDYPPHSGSMVIGDDVVADGDPMILNFTNPVDSLSGYFSYSSRLTFNAYNAIGTFLGSFVTGGTSRLGSSELIALSFTGIGELDIAGETANSFTMDDLSFIPQGSTPMPDGGSTISLFSFACIALGGVFRMSRLSCAGKRLFAGFVGK